MRAAPGFHVEWVDDEAVVLDTQSGLLHYLNAPAALVYALILEHGFEEAIARVGSLNTGAGPPDRNELTQLVEDMKERGLLIDE
jgi:hypothetical protein